MLSCATRSSSAPDLIPLVDMRPLDSPGIQSRVVRSVTRIVVGERASTFPIWSSLNSAGFTTLML